MFGKVILGISFVICAIGSFQSSVIAFVIASTSPLWAIWLVKNRKALLPRFPKIRLTFKRRDLGLAGAIFTAHLVAISLIHELFLLPITVPAHIILLPVLSHFERKWAYNRSLRPYRPSQPFLIRVREWFLGPKTTRMSAVKKRGFWARLEEAIIKHSQS